MSAIGFIPATAPLSAEQLAVGDKRFDRLDGANRGLHLIPNALLNASFDHWQRGAGPFSTTGGPQGYYGPDRWVISNLGSNGTISITRQPLAFGDWPGSSSRFSAVFGVTGHAAASDAAFFGQPIEGVDTLAGRRVVVTGGLRLASGAVGSKVAVELVQVFGTGGSADVNTYLGQVTLTGALTRFAVFADLPSMSGKVIGSAGDFLKLNFFLSAGSNYNARTGNLGLQNISVQPVDLEVKEIKPGFGDNYPGFERILRQLDFWLGKRYYARVVANVRFPTPGFQGSGEAPIYFPNTMRVPPVAAIVISGGNSNLLAQPQIFVTNEHFARFYATAQNPNSDAYGVNHHVELNAEF